jgi:predicted nucleic acid-binding protein
LRGDVGVEEKGRTSGPHSAYLDTCVISGGLGRGDIHGQQEALRELLRLRKAGDIEIVTSHIALEEIQRSPQERRRLDEDLYALLNDVPAAAEHRTDGGLMLLGVGGGQRPDPILIRLREILSDENDARHLFQAIKNGIDFFVTVDERTILSKADALSSVFGIQVLKPAELLQIVKPA